MRLRALLWGSLALNAGLATMVILLNSNVQEAEGPSLLQLKPRGARNDQLNTHVVVRRIPFTWQDIESEDYRAYIKNLRQIGCPEATIRDIIVADVDHLFAERRQTEVITYEQEWWRTDPVVDYAGLSSSKAEALEQERQQLLTTLLGPGWNRDALPPVPELQIREQFMATLSAEQQTAVSKAFAEYREQLSSIRRSEQGTTSVAADPAHAEAVVVQKLKADLAQSLSAEQVEAAMVRYSDLASTLRKELRGFVPSKEEFLQIFRARDQFISQIATLGPQNEAARENYRRTLEARLKQTMGPERYPLYQLSGDATFREAQASLEKLGAPAERVLPLFEINKAMAAERQRIVSNGQLTSGERAAALQEARDDYDNAVRTLLGEDAYKAYTAVQGEAVNR